ncbi:MAG: D-glycero-beta-D-manno-heptose 1-phosphate adenylyltransferase [Aquificaceae bacterium]
MILELNELLKTLETVRTEGKRIVFTNGCFDIVHAGHAYYLQKAKELGDILVVGVNSDSSIRRIKGEKRPIIPEHMRAFLLDSLKPVDYVIVFKEDTPEDLIKCIRPHVLAKGGDWAVENIVGADFVLSYGGKVKLIDFSFDISTSKVIERIIDLYKPNDPSR